jgi:carbamoyl-phosphate synthase large subunit
LNVLVTSAARKVCLIQAFQRALAGRGRVVAADVSPLCPSLVLADEACLLPPSDDPAFAAALERVCRERGVTLVVPTRDEELPLFARLRGRLEAQGVRIMVAAPEVIETCQDKQRFLAFCAREGFAHPRSLEPSSLREPGDFPVFVRPARGKGGQGAGPVSSREELQRRLAAQPGCLVQELVQAPEYTLDLFSDFDGRVISVVPRERVRVLAGESVVSRTCRDPRLVEAGARLAGRLGLVGHNTLQCFLLAGRVLWIEVNPRFGGAANLGFAAGAPTPEFLVRLLQGERLEARLGLFRDGLTMLRYSQDVFLEGDRLAELRRAI